MCAECGHEIRNHHYLKNRGNVGECLIRGCPCEGAEDRELTLEDLL